MKLSQFDFNLPANLVARKPADFRDEARMMVVYRETGEIEHRQFKHIVEYFDEGDVFVVNNTQVFPARLYGSKEKTGAIIEVFLLRELNPEHRLWDVIVDPARKIRVGNKLYFGQEGENDVLVAEVIDNTTSRGRTIRFLNDVEPTEFYRMLRELGETPIPKYMQRGPESEDIERYQTLFAKKEGSVQAPAAGFHFSRETLKWFEIKNIDIAEITLHLGLGAFREIEVEDLSKHKMDSESFEIPDDAAKKVQSARKQKHKVCAVGNTVMRAMESSVSSDGGLKASVGWTEKFIFPPFKFHVADCLLTNFHAPKSAFFISTATFSGYDLLMEVYKEAVKKKYRFLDYGDAMLIL
mgnify:CR=1 FL=1